MLAWTGGRKKLVALAKHKAALQPRKPPPPLRPPSAPRTASAAGASKELPAGEGASGNGGSGDKQLSSGRAKRRLADSFGDAPSPQAGGKPSSQRDEGALPPRQKQPRPAGQAMSRWVPAVPGMRSERMLKLLHRRLTLPLSVTA